jgi:hypothetical protein
VVEVFFKKKIARVALHALQFASHTAPSLSKLH